MKKKVFATVLCLLLLVSMVSAFAVPAGAKEIAGNGYHTRVIQYNGKDYYATLAMNYSSVEGARSTVSCDACVSVVMTGVTVKYDTKNYGYITNSGEGRTGVLSEYVHSISTKYVPCSKGMNQVINYIQISGSATVVSSDSLIYQLNATAINR